MSTYLRSLLIVLAASATVTFGLAFSARGAWADSAGTVHFVRSADSSFDMYTGTTSAATQAWLEAHMWRMTVWAPYFDNKTGWYPNGWLYDDAYAIYRGSRLASEHPEWILRDSAGNMLYIPFGCSGGACPQYAGDISNPAFRRAWVQGAVSDFARGYRGVFVDDVNMDMQVGDGHGGSVAPIDSTTGQAMSATAWRGYMASMMAELRQALPSAEIVHNVIWFADRHAGAADASIRAELSAANYVFLERGVNDEGLTGGTGSWSVNALLSYIDEVHALGRSIVLDGTSREPQGLEYNLAAYLLVSSGSDAVSGGGQTPENWWAGWNVNLGEALGGRFAWNGLLRRNFAGGMVLVNPPGEPTRTVTVPASLTVAGTAVTSVTLPAASGAILTAVSSAPATAPGPGAPTPTQTTLQAQPLPAGPARPAEAVRPSLKRPRSHSLAHRRARAREIQVKGSVRRASRGRVAIQLEARRNRRWRQVALRLTSVDAEGRFRSLLHLSPAVSYRVRALYEGAPAFQASRSGYQRIGSGAS